MNSIQRNLLGLARHCFATMIATQSMRAITGHREPVAMRRQRLSYAYSVTDPRIQTRPSDGGALLSTTVNETCLKKHHALHSSTERKPLCHTDTQSKTSSAHFPTKNKHPPSLTSCRPCVHPPARVGGIRRQPLKYLT